MKHKFKKSLLAFAIFLSLPFATYSRDCGCKQMTLTSGWGYEWSVPDGTSCCDTNNANNASNVFRLDVIRNPNGGFTTIRSRDTIQNAARACC